MHGSRTLLRSARSAPPDKINCLQKTSCFLLAGLINIGILPRADAKGWAQLRLRLSLKITQRG